VREARPVDSDIDLLWVVPDGLLEAGVRHVSAAVEAAVGPLVWVRSDPDLDGCERRRILRCDSNACRSSGALISTSGRHRSPATTASASTTRRSAARFSGRRRAPSRTPWRR